MPEHGSLDRNLVVALPEIRNDNGERLPPALSDTPTEKYANIEPIDRSSQFLTKTSNGDDIFTSTRLTVASLGKFIDSQLESKLIKRDHYHKQRFGVSDQDVNAINVEDGNRTYPAHHPFLSLVTAYRQKNNFKEPDDGSNASDSESREEFIRNNIVFQSDIEQNAFENAVRDPNRPFALTRLQARTFIETNVSLRVGESPVLNPPFQFNNIDDPRTNFQFPHLGRVYNDYIKRNYPILNIMPGEIKYRLGFIGRRLTSVDRGMVGVVRGDQDFSQKVIRAIGSIVSLPFTIIGFLTGKFSRPWIFRPLPVTFGHYFSSLLEEMALNLGLFSERLSGIAGLEDRLNSSGSTELIQRFVREHRERIDETQAQDSRRRNRTQDEEEEVTGDTAGNIYGADNLEGEGTFTETERLIGQIEEKQLRIDEINSEVGLAGVGLSDTEQNNLEAEAEQLNQEIEDLNMQIVAIDEEGIVRTENIGGTEYSSLEGDPYASISVSASNGETSRYIVDKDAVTVNEIEQSIIGRRNSIYTGFPRNLDWDEIAPRISTFRAGISGQRDRANTNWVTFMVQKDISVSEGVSNGFSENPVVQQLNAQSSEYAASKETFQLETRKNLRISVASAIKNPRAEIQRLGGALGERFDRKVGVEGRARISGLGKIEAGQGRLRFPKIWSDSSFSRNVSLEFNLFSPYGDKLSIFENIYIPLIALLTLALPRAVGRESYGSPFTLRAFCQGQFSINYGLISQISITRGADVDGYTVDQLPRMVKVSVGIEDLLPGMILTMNRSILRNVRDIITHNTNEDIRSYLNVLAGFDVHDIFSRDARFDRYWASLDRSVRRRNRTRLHKFTREGVLKNLVGFRTTRLNQGVNPPAL